MARASQQDKATKPVGEVAPMPDPPEDFTEKQIELWEGLYKRFGAWDIDQLALVEAYVRSSASIEHVGRLINNIESQDEIDQKAYLSALNMRERESRLIASLAIRLGIARQTDSRGRPLKPTTSTGRKPWE